MGDEQSPLLLIAPLLPVADSLTRADAHQTRSGTAATAARLFRQELDEVMHIELYALVPRISGLPVTVPHAHRLPQALTPNHGDSSVAIG